MLFAAGFFVGATVALFIVGMCIQAAKREKASVENSSALLETKVQGAV
jgi:hypothetical protein